MDVQKMLDNAATASQHKPLADDPVVIGALLRSIYQWLDHDETGDMDFLKFLLRRHPNFES